MIVPKAMLMSDELLLNMAMHIINFVLIALAIFNNCDTCNPQVSSFEECIELNSAWSSQETSWSLDSGLQDYQLIILIP